MTPLHPDHYHTIRETNRRLRLVGAQRGGRLAALRGTRQRAWITTAEVCDWLGISRETLRHRGWTQGNGPLQWHLEHVEATITGLSRRNLRQ